MLIRRCAVVWLEPREVAHFELDDLLGGGTGVVSRLAWFAHAPHLSAPVEVEAAQVPLLGALGALASWLGGASTGKGAARVLFWGALAMAATALIGRLFGATVA